MLVTAYVVATPGALEWFGSRPLACWALQAAANARGVDRLVLALPPGSGPVDPCVDSAEVLSVPGVKDADVLGVDPEGRGGVAVFVSPGAALLSSGAVERVVSAVVNDGKRSAATALRFDQAFPVNGNGRPIQVLARVPVCRARSLAHQPQAWEEVMVPIDRWEALDALDGVNGAVVRAYVEAGHV